MRSDMPRSPSRGRRRQEVLAVALLVLAHTVMPKTRRPRSSTVITAFRPPARATASASTCSRTSCTRRIDAPRS